jgi:DNA-binding NarL/FixJ family response regulator
MTMAIRVLLVDDHAVVRAGLRAVLEDQPDVEVIGEADNGAAAVRVARKLRPDVVVTDLLLPEVDGIAATQIIRTELPQTQVVILTSVSEDDASVVRAVRAGAIGYVLKNSQIDVLLQTIRSAAQGQVQLSARAAARLVQEMRSPKDHPVLTDREREVLQHITRGHTNKEIAVSLNIAETTVKSHVSAILDKLGVQSRTQAALQAIQSELLSPGQTQAA